jgi:hypothetical protein
MTWIKCSDELPSEDGFYEICSHPDINLSLDGGIAFYDGIGFLICGIYRRPGFWRKFERLEKKYGKINEN